MKPPERPLTQSEYRARVIKHQRLAMVFDTSEILLMTLILLWGLQLSVFNASLQRDALAVPLTSVLPSIPMPVHGAYLIVLSLGHLICVASDRSSWRRRCIGLEALFFLYGAWMLILRGEIGLDLASMCLFALVSAANFHTLMRPT